MRVHVNQAVICKDKTKDKLFKKHPIITKMRFSPNFYAEQLKVTTLSLLLGLWCVKYASQKVVAF